ncbi:hypothetical protein BSL78_26823 [Apostichopus japonicus]|uniref:Uncharacterized protein n=1 Tax=Stichopus japonicus TaxID=307972 RepID=A0A2G8JKR6_STIJA|nr:hypothetical protein BSL78_26823 [Apostichopus japonicus]
MKLRPGTKVNPPSLSEEILCLQPKCNKTGAEYQKEYRLRLKESKEKNDAHQYHEKIRAKLWRLNRSEDGKTNDRELNRLRARRYRERKKGEGKNTTKATKKKVTRAERQMQKEKWCLSKKKQRAQMSSQAKRRMNEKRGAKYAATKAALTPVGSLTVPATNGFTSSTAKRKAVSRSLRILPKDPEKFAEVVSAFVKNATPRKKTALKQSKNSVKSVVQELKKTRTKRDSQLRHLLHVTTAIKNKVNKRTAHKQLGFSWNYLKKPHFPHFQNLRKHRTDAFSTTKAKVATDFYNRGDISREMPVRGKTPLRVMECTTAQALTIFKRENPGFRISFSHFHRLRPAKTKPISKTQLMQCLCEYCVNISFLLETFNKNALHYGHKGAIIHDKYAASDLTLCNYVNNVPRKECIDRTCEKCGIGRMDTHVASLLAAHGHAPVEWKSWELEMKEKGKRMGLLMKKASLSDLTDVLKEKLDPFSKHLVNAKWQAMQFDKLRNNLPHSWVLFCMDYGQNYNCHFQDEAQSAHWSYQQATIHPIRMNTFLVKECKLIERFIFLMELVLNTRTKPFNDASYGVKDYGFPVEKHFFGSRHGKGPCDGEIGVLKKCAAVAVKGRQVIIRDAHDLFKYGQNFLSLPRDVQEHSHAKRTFFFVRQGEVVTDFRMVRNNDLKPIPQTRALHCFIGIAPSVVTACERSCFCSECTSGKYVNCKDATFVGKRSNYALKSGLSLEMADGQEADATSEANGQTKPTYTYAKGSFVAVKLYGKQSCTSRSEDDIHVNFMKRCGDNLYNWPAQRDVSWEPRENVVCQIDFPDLANKREQFRFKKSHLTIIENHLRVEPYQFK